MKKGGRRYLIIPPAWAYGAQGVAARVPPDSTLVFEVEVRRVSVSCQLFVFHLLCGSWVAASVCKVKTCCRHGNCGSNCYKLNTSGRYISLIKKESKHKTLNLENPSRLFTKMTLF